MWKFETGIEGTLRFGTSPIRSGYIMLSSTEIQPDFDKLQSSGFKNQWDYASNLSAAPLEYGSILNFRIFTSSQAAVIRNSSMNGRDVYYNTCVGRQAVTHIDQSGESMRLLYRGPEFSGPLMMNASLGVKFWQSQGLTQDTAIRQLASTRSS